METGSLLRFVSLFLLVFPMIDPLPNFARAAPQFYPQPESRVVTEAGLAADGQRLVTFYCYLDPEADPFRPSMKYGGLKEWNGQMWADLWADSGYGTNYCVDCDVAIRGDVIVASHRNSSYGSDKATHHSNYNGVWQAGTEATFYSVSSPRVAFAFGVPYMTFTSIGSGGPRKVYIQCLYGCDGLPELSGTYRYFGVGIPSDVSSASLTGDAEAFYSAFVSVAVPTDAGEGCVNVRRVTRFEDEYLGGCFYGGDQPFHTDIVLFQGQPVVAYKADDGRALWIARWSGSAWVNIGTDTVGAGLTFGRLRAAASATQLFVGFEVRGAEDYQIIVYEFKAPHWVAYPVPLDPAKAMACVFQDLVLLQGQAVAAYIEDGTLKVVNLSGATGDRVFLPGLHLLLGE